ncbi:cysteine hydrolase family protein [Bartonella sp. HY038]|uniref:cysteine hydrolase family protein n=1 Tax=Bartonella sp. HY038 TaxID=2759660 RepID=UPI0015FAB4D8|nr:cysteine hydrolase family protein [Bartonella sp. HY038]
MKHPTLRTIAGAAIIENLQFEQTALLVIDFQNEYFIGSLPIPNGMAALKNAKNLIEYADENAIAVFHVQHIAPQGSATFAQDSAMSAFHSDILPKPHHKIVQKNMPSVFASSDIDMQLKAAGINTLIICGLMTHMCVSAAAREAIPLGYNIVVAEDACATRSIDFNNEDTIDYTTLHKASLVTLNDAFGDVMTVNQIINLECKS